MDLKRCSSALDPALAQSRVDLEVLIYNHHKLDLRQEKTSLRIGFYDKFV